MVIEIPSRPPESELFYERLSNMVDPAGGESQDAPSEDGSTSMAVKLVMRRRERRRAVLRGMK